jgi:hypothetical protein
MSEAGKLARALKQEADARASTDADMSNANLGSRRQQYVARAQRIWDQEISKWGAARIEAEFVEMLADEIGLIDKHAGEIALIEEANEARKRVIQETAALYKQRIQKFSKKEAA